MRYSLPVHILEIWKSPEEVNKHIYDEVIPGGNLGALLKKTCRLMENKRGWRSVTSVVARGWMLGLILV